MRTSSLVFAALLLVPSTAAAGPIRPSGGDRGYVVAPPETQGGGEVSNVIYLNRCAGGCDISPGQDDSRVNTSGVIDETTHLSEFAWSDETWNAVVDCL